MTQKRKGWIRAAVLLFAVVCLTGAAVTAKAEDKLTLSGTGTMLAGETEELSVKADVAELPENPEYTWKTSDSAVVSVENTGAAKNTLTANGAGKATVTVDLNGTDLTASFAVEVALAQPVLSKAVVTGATSAVVSWKKVDGAAGYRIYRKSGSDKYRKLVDVTGGDITTYTDKKCELGVKYTYTVSAYAAGKKNFSAASTKGVSAKTSIGTPVLVEAKDNGSGGITITWKSVSGAEKYRIYRRAASSKSWSGSQLAEIKPATTYVDTDVKPGYSYTYTVRAMVGKKLGGYDDTGVTATVEVPQPKLIGTISKGATKLEIMWESVEGATNYRVYRLNKEEKKWDRLSADTTTTYFVDNTVKAEVEYTYTVRAAVKVDGAWVLSEYDQTVTGKTTADKTKITFASPKLLSAKQATAVSGIAVTWVSAPGADGYYIYRKTGSSKWKKVGSVTGNATTTWTDKKCKLGKKYSYTVRGWLTYDKDTVLSTNWDAKGVSCKAGLAAPELKSASANGPSSITVSWKKVAGAKGYRVYRKTENSNWKKLKDTKALFYTDTSITKSTKYTYTVRAYYKSGKKKKLGAYDENGVTTEVKIVKKTSNGLELYYNGDGKLITDTSSIIGKQSSYKIEVDYNKNIVTVYAKGSTGSYNLPVKAFVCSTGKDTPIGTFYTPAKYRWKELLGPCWGQWSTRIHGGVLFHSVPYKKSNNMSLNVSMYNKLGTKCSHGCVRLKAGDAKWIYENCKLGTAVKISTSCKNPFGKPTSYKLKKAHTWDPTDPTAYYKCKKNGCH